MSCRLILSTVAMTASLASVPGSAQTLAVKDPPTCAACRIVLDSVLTLDGTKAPQVGTTLAIHRLKDGRVLAAFNESSGELMLFSASGRFLRTIGRPGSGPGEYSTIQFIGSAGGDIHVFDIGHERRTVLDSLFQPKRTDQIRVPVEKRRVAFFADGSFVISGAMRTREHAGLPLHTFKLNGAHEFSFGDTLDVFDASTLNRLVQTFAPATGGRFWAADVVRYRITLWDRSGRRLSTVTRSPEWFTREGTLIYVNNDAPPPANISGIWQDGAGLLWVVATVPDRRWRQAVRQGPTREGRPSFEVVDGSLWLDTVIDVIDPRLGKLVATARLDAAIGRVLDDGYVASGRDTPNGEPIITIWKVSLRRN